MFRVDMTVFSVGRAACWLSVLGVSVLLGVLGA